jgi:hypothetical protein
MTAIDEVPSAFEEFEKEDLQDELELVEDEIFELHHAQFRLEALQKRRVELRQLLGLPEDND